MAKAELHITLDATLLIKAYNQGMEDAFMIIADSYGEFDKLESTLNITKIDLPDNGEA